MGIVGALIRDVKRSFSAKSEDDDEDDNEDLAIAAVHEIIEKCLGFKVKRGSEISQSDWDEEDLSDEQVVYASVNANCAFLIGKNFKAWKFT